LGDARRDDQNERLRHSNLLEAVRLTTPLARILIVSSSDVYGFGPEPAEALNENALIQVLDPYAYSKAAGEMLCGFYERVENLDIVIARPFPHTGPGQAEDFVCSDWARQVALIEKGERAPVLKVGNLDVRRDFSDVRDVVRAYLLLIRNGRRGEVYNVCSGNAVALREILDLLIKEASGNIPVSIEVDAPKLRKSEAGSVTGSNRKISEETGWSPRIPIGQTLHDIVAFWRQRVGERL
jgi:GDP-4-dehydro-6-deoxy-D-mannose reductase